MAVLYGGGRRKRVPSLEFSLCLATMVRGPLRSMPEPILEYLYTIIAVDRKICMYHSIHTVSTHNMEVLLSSIDFYFK